MVEGIVKIKTLYNLSLYHRDYYEIIVYVSTLKRVLLVFKLISKCFSECGISFSVY